jgi:hypothetical protein
VYQTLLLIALIFITGCAPKPTPQAEGHCLSAAQLNSYSYEELSHVAQLLRADSRNVDDFNTFIVATKGSVNDYANIIKSSVYLTNVVRFLPIPYAGEVSNVTKLVSGTVLHLNSAAVALDRYKKSNAAFLSAFEKLNGATATPAELNKLALFADTTLMKDARELHTALQKISASTALIAATAQTISNAMETTSGYFNQAKSLVGITQEANDKVQLTTSHDTLNGRLALLNQKIVALENSADTYQRNISKARTFTELAIQIDLPR